MSDIGSVYCQCWVFFSVTCVGDWSILGVVWSMLVPVHDVGVGSMLGFAQ